MQDPRDGRDRQGGMAVHPATDSESANADRSANWNGGNKHSIYAQKTVKNGRLVCSGWCGVCTAGLAYYISGET